MSIENALDSWKVATSNLDYGVQRAFIDVLGLAMDEQNTLIWGADYSGKGACLVNQAGPILLTGGGHGVPSRYYGEVVSLFDRINRYLHEKGINSDHTVSPLAAEILIRNFAPLKPRPKKGERKKVFEHAGREYKYTEPTDTAMMEDLLAAFSQPAPNDLSNLNMSIASHDEVIASDDNHNA